MIPENSIQSTYKTKYKKRSTTKIKQKQMVLF